MKKSASAKKAQNSRAAEKPSGRNGAVSSNKKAASPKKAPGPKGAAPVSATPKRARSPTPKLPAASKTTSTPRKPPPRAAKTAPECANISALEGLADLWVEYYEEDCPTQYLSPAIAEILRELPRPQLDRIWAVLDHAEKIGYVSDEFRSMKFIIEDRQSECNEASPSAPRCTPSRFREEDSDSDSVVMTAQRKTKVGRDQNVYCKVEGPEEPAPHVWGYSTDYTFERAGLGAQRYIRDATVETKGPIAVKTEDTSTAATAYDGTVTMPLSMLLGLLAAAYLLGCVGTFQ